MPSRWNEDGDVMSKELFIEVMEGLLEMITDRIEGDTVTSVPAVAIIASPCQNEDNDHPYLSMWMIGEFSSENKHNTVRNLGESIAEKSVIISAAFLIAEAWVTDLDDSQKGLEKGATPAVVRSEAITITGQDIEGNSIAVVVRVNRHPDNNKMQITDIEKIYPKEEGMDTFVRSTLLDILFSSYAEKMHLLEFGVPIDPHDPFKMLRKAMESGA